MKRRGRTGYAGRRTRRARTTRGGFSRLDNDAKKQLSVMAYPHSKMTLNPKIPDGVSVQSTGLRFQQGFNYQFTEPTTYLIIYPGLGSFCAVYPANSAGVPTTGPAGIWPTPAVLYSNRTLYQGAVGTLRNLNVARWRQVSCGVRIRNTNNDDNNDGSWEAIRLSTPNDPQQWATLQAADAGYVPFTTDALHSIIPQFADKITNLNFAQNNSYCSGQMKDLHRKYFMLKEQQPTHEFTEIPEKVTGYANGTATSLATAGFSMNVTTPALTDQAQMMCDKMLDKACDTIIIKLNGKVGTNPTTILIDGCQSQELEYMPSSAFLRTMNETAYSLSAINALRDRQRRRLLRAAI